VKLPRETLLGILIVACIALTATVCGQVPSSAASNGVALVVGNTRYQIGDLSNASKDAEDIASALKDLGFEVQLLKDLDQRGLAGAIKAFGQSAKNNGKTAVFYFSGHGIQVNTEDYLIPIDVISMDTSEIARRSVPLQNVFDALGVRVAPNVVILDACRVTGPFVTGLAEPGNPTPNSLIAFSTSPGTVASDGEGVHSPYTRALLRYIRIPGQNTSELFTKVREDVKANTDNVQVPWENTSLSSDLIFRDPAYVDAQFTSADDDALILLNGQEVLDWNRDGGTRKRLRLRAGGNDFQIMVYNQRSYTGGIPGLGGHLPEGWNYSLSLTRTDGQALVSGLSAMEDRPADNGPHHGKLFTVAMIKVLVDDKSNTISVQSIDSNVWNRP
jgi:hypothetical protein